MMPGKTADASTNPSDGEPGHKHVLVKMKDAQGKTYYTCSMHPQVHLDHPGNCPICGMPLIEKTEPASADATVPTSERKPLYWYDPMKPDQHFDKPGKSPFMDMQLVPMYAADASGGNIISIDPRTVQNLGIRTALVERKKIAQELRAAGSIAINENRIEVVQTRAAGWVEKLHVRALNDTVRKGQLLAEVYAPDLFAAQQEYLLASRAHDDALTAEGRFLPVDVRLGVQRDGQTEVLEGLSESQKVVASGQFLIDSEANLRGAFNRLDTANKPAENASMEKGP